MERISSPPQVFEPMTFDSTDDSTQNDAQVSKLIRTSSGNETSHDRDQNKRTRSAGSMIPSRKESSQSSLNGADNNKGSVGNPTNDKIDSTSIPTLSKSASIAARSKEALQRHQVFCYIYLFLLVLRVCS
jgi:hypothetical protein